VTIETDGKIIGKAGGDIEVEGQKITIKGGADINIEAGGSATVSATGQLTLKGMGVSVDGGGGVVKVSGSQIMLG
jgi:type VI secretion system secreted protein VgrG